MRQRRHDTEIWEMDWFINMPHVYKLLYLWIWDHAEQCGIWRPKISTFRRNIVENQIVTLKEFLHHVNRNEDPDDRSKRVVELENGNWLITGLFTIELGDHFRYTIGAHRGALRELVKNKIHPAEIGGFDWGVLETFEFEYISVLAQVRPKHGETLDDILAMLNARGKRKEERGNTVFKEPTILTTTTSENFSKNSEEEKKFVALLEMFDRAGAKEWEPEKKKVEIGRFINKNPDLDPRKAGPAVNSWIANYENFKNNDNGKANRTGAKPGLLRDKP